MTYHGQPSRTTNTVMKTLVIITILWVAYWAANGGLDQIGIPVSSPAATTTTVVSGG